MKIPGMARTFALLCVVSFYTGVVLTGVMAEEEAPPQAVQEAPEREININIHSGLRTIPIRKVIGMVMERAKKRGIITITGRGMRRKDKTWILELNVIDKEGTQRTFKWKYLKDEWDLAPLNEDARQVAFPFDKYVFGPAINMALNMIEQQDVSPKEIDGSANLLDGGQWAFDLAGISDTGERFTQEWNYDTEKGVMPAHFDHSDLDRLLKESVKDGKVDYDVVKDTRHLKRFLKKIAKTRKEELESFSREEQFAFWINAYNGIMLKILADNYPKGTAESITRAIKKKKFKVAGKKRKLAQIRDEILPAFEDQRVDLALLHPSWDSGIRAEAYCGRLLEDQLSETARDFNK